MVKVIIEPKKAKDGQIDYVVTYHDVKTDNQFTVTITNDLDDAVQRLKETAFFSKVDARPQGDFYRIEGEFRND